MDKCLVLGCGNRRDSSLINAVYLDIDPDCKPDVVHDLTKHPLPFKDEEFNKIYAVHVLEHLAYQGDVEFFFREFEEYWRILKPEGRFIGVCPLAGTKWAWGDPGHRRVIQKETLLFLDRDMYNQVGVTTMGDYRYLYKKGNFKVVDYQEQNGNSVFTLIKRRV